MCQVFTRFQTKKGPKAIPFGEALTSMAYIGEYPPPPPPVLLKIPCPYKYTIVDVNLNFSKRSNRIFLHWLQRFVLRNLVRKKSSDAPRVTFFMNLKEHNREFLLTGLMVWILRNIEIPDWREGLKSSLEVLHLTNSLLYKAFNKLYLAQRGN